MMRKIFILAIMMILTLSLFGCGKCSHDWADADCLSPKTCKLCGTVDGEALGHEFDAVVTPPTCTDKGYTTHTCKRCGITETDNYVEAHGHTYGDWAIVSPIMPDETEGMKRANCVNCDKFKIADLEVTAEGSLGSSAVYRLFEDGTLLISGNGTTADCGWNGANQPYAEHRNKVTRAVVGEGITDLRGGVFAYMPNLKECEFPSTLKRLNNNTFMDSFSADVTSFTIPGSVNYAGNCTVGQYKEKNALFTDIYIENPNITLAETDQYIPFNSYAGNCGGLTLYSYGTSNNVRIFADKYGIKYVDLNSTVLGEIGNLAYNYFDGTLTLSSVKENTETIIPADITEKIKIDRSAVKQLIIEADVSEIPARCFKDYTGLTSVTLPDTLNSIGAEAFGVTKACDNELRFSLGEEITYLSPDFLKNRTGVYIDAFKGTAADGFTANGVKLTLRNSLKILLIGNSLSLDAADYLNLTRPSQLYSIIKSMTGDTSFVEIAVLYSGAKTAGWHATVAEAELPVYQFYVISDDTEGKWVEHRNYTTKQGLTFDDWDIVTIQPYASEAQSGIGSTSDTDTNPEKTSPVKAEKFYPLDTSLPYLLDYIAAYCEDASVYYYLTWSNSSTPTLNHKADNYSTMLEIAKKAMTYKGSGGKGFDKLIPVGTAIQNARSTFLGLINYTDPSNTNFNQIGLQRDGVHLSVEVGRYIAGLSFAELIVPEEYRQENYILPKISASALGGTVTEEYTDAAQLCVKKMLESCNATGDDKYKPTEISGYSELP